MGLRPAKCYRSLKDRAYTRIAITKHNKNYIGATPGIKIKQFNMGNPVKEYTHVVDLCCNDAMIIRDNAIEACRIAINRFITNKVSKENYFLRVRVYPFHIMRENKQAQGAGADRVSQGMAHSFGKAIGRAIRTRKGQVLFSLLVEEENIDVAKKAMSRTAPKLPCTITVKVHTNLASIGTMPRANKMKIVEKKAEEEEKAEEEKDIKKKNKKDQTEEESKEESTEDKDQDAKEEKK